MQALMSIWEVSGLLAWVYASLALLPTDGMAGTV